MEWVYICGYGGTCDPDFVTKYEELGEVDKKEFIKKMKNVYMVSWTRFGNISLEKYDPRNGSFVAK